MKKKVLGIIMFLMLVMGLNCFCFAESGVTAEETIPSHNITLRPIITARSYSITYNLDGGTVAVEMDRQQWICSKYECHDPKRQDREPVIYS